MSQQDFQTLMARLVVDPAFRDRVSSLGDIALPRDLGARERERLIFAAGSKGIDITRTLHKGFRLGKILSLLPLTCSVMGNTRLARQVDRFWKEHSSVSFYYLEEALAFCSFIERRIRAGLRITYLEEIIAYERARLELQLPQSGDRRVEPRKVRFIHDPEQLLLSLARGRRPRAVPRRPCVLEGSLDQDGNVEWAIVLEQPKAEPKADATQALNF